MSALETVVEELKALPPASLKATPLPLAIGLFVTDEATLGQAAGVTEIPLDNILRFFVAG